MVRDRGEGGRPGGWVSVYVHVILCMCAQVWEGVRY